MLAALILCASLRAETAAQRLLEDKLLYGKVEAAAHAIHGVLGVAAIDLTSGRVFVFNGEAEFPTASTIKIPIMVELFRQAEAGSLRLDDRITKVVVLFSTDFAPA